MMTLTTVTIYFQTHPKISQTKPKHTIHTIYVLCIQSVFKPYNFYFIEKASLHTNESNMHYSERLHIDEFKRAIRIQTLTHHERSVRPIQTVIHSEHLAVAD